MRGRLLLCIAFALVLTLAGCARYAHGSAKVALGMTRPEVLRACGRPNDRATRGAAEHWYYHDTAWHGLEWSSERTSRFTDVAFVGGRVASFGPAPATYRATSHPGATPTPTATSSSSGR